MAYPNTSVLNIIIPQTSASIQDGQAPFVERIISGSRLVLQTTIDGTLTGSSDLNVNSITASNISASGYISASNLYVKTNITDAGTLNVLGNSVLTSLTASTALFSGMVSASAGLTASAIQDAGTLTVVGNSILSTVFATNVTASNISASGNISASNEYIAGTLTVIGNSTLSTVFATNITASNISASGNISASTLRVETSIVDGGTLTVLGNTVLGDTVTDTTRITGSTSISGSLSVVGNSTLQSTFVTNLTASNISASGFISGSDGVFAGDVAVNGGDITTTVTGTATLFNTNATSVTIGGAATGQVLLGNSAGAVKSVGDFIVGTNSIKDGTGGLAITTGATLTTIAGDLQVNGNDIKDSSGTNNLTFSGSSKVTVPLTTQATAFNAAALVVAGGVGIGKNLHVSGSTFLYGDLTIYGSGSNEVNIGVNSSDTASFKVANNAFRVINGTGATGDKVFTTLPISASNRVLFSNTTQATDWTTGALNVVGGVGIGKDLHVSGSTFVYGDFTVFGSSSVVYISSSTVIINDNIIQLNAFFPFERYAGIEVFDSGSNQRSASLLWDGHNDNWITVDQNNSSSNVIVGPTASFGTNPGSLTANNIPKAYDATGITTSSLSDDGTTLRYTGNVISASSITASYGTFTYITGALVTYVTGSFTTLTIATGSSPGPGNVAVPTNPTASGMPGQINVDNNFVYVYTNNIWKRVPLSTWSL